MLELWNQDMSLLSLIQFLTLNRTLNWSGRNCVLCAKQCTMHLEWLSMNNLKRNGYFEVFQMRFVFIFWGNITEFFYPSLLTWALDLFTREIKEKQWWRGWVGGGGQQSHEGDILKFFQMRFLFFVRETCCAKSVWVKLVEPAPNENFALNENSIFFTSFDFHFNPPVLEF
jgi:hypothetical protein